MSEKTYGVLIWCLYFTRVFGTYNKYGYYEHPGQPGPYAHLAPRSSEESDDRFQQAQAQALLMHETSEEYAQHNTNPGTLQTQPSIQQLDSQFHRMDMQPPLASHIRFPAHHGSREEAMTFGGNPDALFQQVQLDRQMHHSDLDNRHEAPKDLGIPDNVGKDFVGLSNVAGPSGRHPDMPDVGALRIDEENQQIPDISSIRMDERVAGAPTISKRIYFISACSLLIFFLVGYFIMNASMGKDGTLRNIHNGNEYMEI